MAATTALALATAAVFVATPAGASRRTSTPHRSVEAVVNRMGGIAGRVTDTSGEGIKGVCVTAVNRTVIEGATVTGRTGRYLFGGLMAGRYRLEFTTCSSSERYFPEWYPGTSSALTGRQVTVTPGRLGHVGDVVLHSLGMGSAARSSSVRKADRTRTRMLARLGSRASAATSVRTGATGSISGIVTDLSKKPLEGICVDAFGISPNVGSGFAATAANGTYTVTGLPAGGYTVEFSGIYCGNSGNYLPQWYDGQSSDASATTVNVTAGKTTGGISAMMLPGGAITGAVTASGKPLSGVGVTAFGANGGYGSTSTAANGTYTITQLPADTYTVEFSASVGNYLIQWWDGQSSQGTATPLPLKAGEIAKNIDAKMLSGGIITGTVTNTKGTALSGICVSANSVIAGGVSEYAQTLGGGHYSVQSLPTGS
ncbi:MAG TPA: carboxypeptidase-like regulatory domain-containing protein, partial [Acidimicrobiales bacterium]|nr:carboxypeptidase-like regulatory domain-containing protein [Acidimicrobiales bacterium]